MAQPATRQRMTFDQIAALVLPVLPDAVIEQDAAGEWVISTGIVADKYAGMDPALAMLLEATEAAENRDR